MEMYFHLTHIYSYWIKKNISLVKFICYHSFNRFITREVLHLNIQLIDSSYIFFNYRASWMAQSSLLWQQNFVQEIKQIGTIVHLPSTVTTRVVMPAYQTKTLQNCWSFVIHLKFYPSKKVNADVYRKR